MNRGRISISTTAIKIKTWKDKEERIFITYINSGIHNLCCHYVFTPCWVSDVTFWFFVSLLTTWNRNNFRHKNWFHWYSGIFFFSPVNPSIRQSIPAQSLIIRWRGFYCYFFCYSLSSVSIRINVLIWQLFARITKTPPPDYCVEPEQGWKYSRWLMCCKKWTRIFMGASQHRTVK